MFSPATIVDSHVPRVWLGEPDAVIIGRGEGEVEVGDQYQIFRPGAEVYHPVTGRVYGYAIKELGWLQIEEVHPETSTGIIHSSRGEIRRGDHVAPRVHREAEIEVGATPDIEGVIVFTPDDRLNMAMDDVVYLDRGSSDGLQVGSPLEVYRPIGTGVDKAQHKKVALPDGVVAKLLVVHVEKDTASAVVTHARAEVERGDRFRGSDSLAWQSVDAAF